MERATQLQPEIDDEIICILVIDQIMINVFVL